MMLRRNRLSVRVRQALIAGLAAAATSVAVAQSVPPPADEPATLDAITVTAQSREQDAQDVPIALQVLDETLIDDVAAEDLGDIDDYVPGLVVNAQQPTQPRIELRGIATSDFGIGTDPAVGVYVDGVYAGRGGGVVLPFVDVERIEVLKGPQGTLFGRNTAAGAISIVTHRPDLEFDANATARFAGDGKQYFQGMLNAPVGEDSAFRIVGLSDHADGWLQDAVTGRDLAPEANWATRAAFATRFGGNTDFRISWDHEELDQLGQATIGIVDHPAAPGLIPLPIDEADYLDPFDAPAAVDVEGNEEARRFDGVTAVIEHDFGGVTLTSTTAWRDFDSINRVEEDGTARIDLYVDSVNTESNANLYQEFRFGGGNDRVDWVAGASWFDENADQTSEVNAFTDSVDSIVRNLGLAPTPDGSLYGFTTAVMNANGIPFSLLGHRWNEKFVNGLDTTAFALYGDIIWHATDRLNLTFGLRYTWDEKEFTWFNDHRTAPTLDATLDRMEAFGIFGLLGIPRAAYEFDIAFIDPPALANKGVVTRTSQRWDDFSPRFVADYRFSDDLMGFASLAKGYKAGGFNALQIGSEFANEDVWNLETGLKGSLDDLRLRWNASTYWYRYDDRQAIRLDTTTAIPRYVVDTSDVEAWGVDFDAHWRATDGLTLDLVAAYIDSTYAEYTTPEGDDLDGQPTGTPEWSLAAGGSYLWMLGDAGDVRLSLRHAFRGETRCSDESETQGTCGVSDVLELGESQERTDVRLGWESASGALGLAVYGNNVFDHRYVTSLGTYGRSVLGTVGARVSEPRTWGVEMRVAF